MICDAAFDSFVNGTVVPLAAYASVFTSIIIALVYMVGNATNNPKLLVWGKTEVLQLVLSAGSVIILMMVINFFCILNMNDVASVFDVDTPGGSLSMYAAAEEYLVNAAKYAHNAMTAIRYHLEAYTILNFLNAFKCDFNTGGIGWGCLFGYSGANQQPFGGYGAVIAGLNIFFNSSIIAFFSAMNFLFILLFVQKGFVFIFLPLGIFLRSMPYLRSFGSILIAIAISFSTIYPLMLGVYWIMSNTLLDAPNLYPAGMDVYLNENVFPNNEGAASAGASIGASFTGGSAVYNTYFPSGENVPGAIAFAANAFVAAVFLPTVALLAAIASVAYLSRLYGEAVDLSRITQLV